MRSGRVCGREPARLLFRLSAIAVVEGFMEASLGAGEGEVVQSP